MSKEEEEETKDRVLADNTKSTLLLVMYRGECCCFLSSGSWIIVGVAPVFSCAH
jgi:hypothetical protein